MRESDHGQVAVVFIAVNVDKDLAKGTAFLRSAKLQAMLCGFEPSGATADTYEPPTMPVTFVIGKRGIVRDMHKGYRTGDEDGLMKTLDKLLAK